ncbi:MAG TPA: hypothetical protein EYP56_08245, partial [Planctomycetaceae bacterium]|nr:hypothetical protein [Planctomycetaceae bacterium]
MQYLIGMDEAGYGPNLGPLVITATVWEVPGGVEAEELYDRLREAVTPVRGETRDDSDRLAIADSKLLYSTTKGLRHLELGVLATLAAVGLRPATWRAVWDQLAPDSGSVRQTIPWYARFDAPIPVEASADKVGRLADLLRRQLSAAGLRLVRTIARAVFVQEFNRLLEQYGSKGAALSHTALTLAAAVLEDLPARPAAVVCDRHGGRKRYGQLLAEHFPPWLVEVDGEDPIRSVYRFGPADRRVEFCFRVGAESCLPVALASMTSK